MCYLYQDVRRNLQEIEKKTLTNSISARPVIMFLLLLCGFLNSNPDQPFSCFTSTVNFHSCLYSLLGLQNLQSQHREDTSDYSSKQCTKEINFCKGHLCIDFLCSRSWRLHKASLLGVSYIETYLELKTWRASHTLKRLNWTDVGLFAVYIIRPSKDNIYDIRKSFV